LVMSCSAARGCGSPAAAAFLAREESRAAESVPAAALFSAQKLKARSIVRKRNTPKNSRRQDSRSDLGAIKEQR